VTENSANRKSV